MSLADLAATIDAAWEARAEIAIDTKGAVRDAVEAGARACSTAGKARVAEKVDGDWARQPVAQEGGAALLPPQRQHA